MGYELIAGMASFMEDDGIEASITINQGEAEPTEQVVEDQIEAEESSAEAAAVTEEAEAADEQAEMILDRFEQIFAMKRHVETYGVDRTFLSLMDYDGHLSQRLGVSLPSCESFDSVGSPHSRESMAVLASLENFASKVWDFIKSVCRKITAFMSRIWEAIKRSFGGLEKQVNRLEKMFKNREERTRDEMDNVEATVADPGQLVKVLKETKFTSGVWLTIKQGIEAVFTSIRGLSKTGAVKNEANSLKAKLDQVKHAAENESMADVKAENRDVSRFSPKQIDGLLAAIREAITKINDAKSMIDNCTAMAKELEQKANSLSNGNPEAPVVKAAKEASSAASGISTLVTSQINRYRSVAFMAVKTCSIYINRCMKPKKNATPENK